MIKAIAVFCGSKPGNNPVYEEHTRILGNILAANNIGIIYGGSCKGLMGAVADSALERNGVVIGIMPELLQQWENQHSGISELLIVDTMHTRKKMLYEKCDAAIILPGGFGTLDEYFEALTLIQTAKISEFPIIVFDTEFHADIIAHIEKMKLAGTISPEDLDLCLFTDSVDEAVKHIQHNSINKFGLKEERKRKPSKRKMNASNWRFSI